MNHELVSVIIAVYNTDQYVGKCLESILNQTYKQLQIIAIDDGSKDQSGEVCDQFASKDERIEVIHQKNQGLSAVRNEGIRRAQGKWIAFVDGDDYVHPQFIKKLYDAAVTNDCQISICDYLKVKEGKAYAGKSDNDKQFVKTMSFEEMLKNWHGKNKRIETVAWNKLYAAELFQKVSYPVGKMHDDVLTTHRLVGEADQIAVIQDQLYYYVQRQGSIVRGQINEYKVKETIAEQKERLAFFHYEKYPLAYQNLKRGIKKHILYYWGYVLIAKNLKWQDKRELFKYLHGEWRI